LRRKLNEDDTYFPPEEYEQTHYLQAILRNPPTLINIKTNYTEIDIS